MASARFGDHAPRRSQGRQDDPIDDVDRLIDQARQALIALDRYIDAMPDPPPIDEERRSCG
jgi:hypothetical protein